MGLSIDDQKAVEQFKTEVVDPSMTNLVIVDFWAEWCGPCKALTPLLEKIAAEYADKGVVLAKINVDEQQFIASQFQVKSIPTVYAMFQGQPVADLTPARTESQLKQMLDELLAKLPIGEAAAGAPGAIGGGVPGGGAGGQVQDVTEFIAMAEQILADGDGERATGIFAQVVQMAPDNAAANAGLIRALVAAGRKDEAQGLLSSMEAPLKDDPLVKQAGLAVELAGTDVDPGELQILRAATAESPADMGAGFAFAEAAYAAGERDEAADTLLRLVQTDGTWNEGAAKAKLLQIFEAVGLEDPWVVSTRRKLSRVLFG